MWIAERYLPIAQELYKKVKDEGCTGVRLDIGADGTMSFSAYTPMIVGYEEDHANYDFKTGEFYDVSTRSVNAEAG